MFELFLCKSELHHAYSISRISVLSKRKSKFRKALLTKTAVYVTRKGNLVEQHCS